jgi:hypothetical protein
MARWQRFGSKAGRIRKAGQGGASAAVSDRAEQRRHEYHLEERFEAGLALQGWG